MKRVALVLQIVDLALRLIDDELQDARSRKIAGQLIKSLEPQALPDKTARLAQGCGTADRAVYSATLIGNSLGAAF